MTATTIDCKVNEQLALSKGANIQEFVAQVGGNKLEISIARGARAS